MYYNQNFIKSKGGSCKELIHTLDLTIVNVNTYNLIEYKNRFKKRFPEEIYFYDYKGCNFKYYAESNNLVVEVNVQKILNTTNPKLSDKGRFLKELNKILLEVVIFNDYNITKLTRIDYYVDLKTSNEDEKKEILKILNKNTYHYKYMKQKEKYVSSIYLSTKCGSFNLNFYDKYQQLLDVHHIRDERYKGVIRFEVHVKKPKLIRLEKEHNIPRTIDVYYSKEFMELLYWDIIRDYLHLGDNLKLTSTIDIINKSNLSYTIKKNLIHFVRCVDMVGYDKTSKKYSYSTLKGYIKKLDELGVNPICVDKNSKIEKVDSIFKRLEEISNQKYFI